MEPFVEENVRGIEPPLSDGPEYSMKDVSTVLLGESKMRGIEPPLRVLWAGGASEYGGSASPILCFIVSSCRVLSMVVDSNSGC